MRGHHVADASGRRQRPEGAAVRVQAGRPALLNEDIGEDKLVFEVVLFCKHFINFKI